MTTIVVVDDESLITDFLSFFLKAEGYTVHAARDGQSALDMIGSVMPDVVLTDFMMPAMSGLELAQALKKDTRLAHIPVILATAAQGAAAEAYPELFAAVLDKPYPPPRLLDALNSALARSGKPDGKIVG
ncbi:response regulator [Paraburkholderia caribensis]|jgi:CheY-like chemotaxis protein|uniref:response regulator n=1 Tax=Paraburkholderia caribensis TaxID=75105 RepID=UPI001CB12141|nr:response regulator [Paraburkholderia caribensis]GJH37597.1 response regulator [Paraburkholderia hospita]CAG9253687.1 Response regulatory domain-containing protein [Paraburkholderia caribensis]